ncbi:hypothetical protein BDZ97DRAFT_1753602 [Flammula alnicola]|nr:hypothetical protein BDZ97DRAFT_1753602 [Flammula alnicola]
MIDFTLQPKLADLSENARVVAQLLMDDLVFEETEVVGKGPRQTPFGTFGEPFYEERSHLVAIEIPSAQIVENSGAYKISVRIQLTKLDEEPIADLGFSVGMSMSNYAARSSPDNVIQVVRSLDREGIILLLTQVALCDSLCINADLPLFVTPGCPDWTRSLTSTVATSIVMLSEEECRPCGMSGAFHWIIDFMGLAAPATSVLLVPLEDLCIIISISRTLYPLIAEHRTSSIGIDSSAPARLYTTLPMYRIYDSSYKVTGIQSSAPASDAALLMSVKFEFEMLVVLKSKISDLGRSNSAKFE